MLLTVADGACPVVAGSHAAPRGHAPCGFEFLFLPLRHFGKTHSRILGMVTAAAQPPWLGLLPLEPLSLSSLRIVDEVSMARERLPSRIAVGAPMRANASDPMADELTMEGGVVRGGKPHLRLIQGGRSSR